MRQKLTDLAATNGEVVFDSLLDNGVLKDIPLLGNIANVLKLKGDVTNYIFAKKLEALLRELKEGRVDEAVLDLHGQEDLERIGRDLVFVIEKASNIDKAKWLARAVVGLIENRYDVGEFERLVYIIDGFAPTLRSTLAVWYEWVGLNDKHGYVCIYYGDQAEELANLGLLRRRYEAKVSNDGCILVRFEACDLGKHMWHILEGAK